MDENLLLQVAAAYDGVESPEAFTEAGALEKYRAGLLERTTEQADFIAGRTAPGGRAIEVACGNGRLLLALRQRDAVAEGLGIDIAASRIAFAERWLDDLGLTGLSFRTDDLVTAQLGDDLDLAICITGALAYFDPAREGLAGEILGRLSTSLRPGGLLVLELYPHPEERALLDLSGGEIRTWRELPSDDPWRYYLSHLNLSGDVLSHEKAFVHRSSGRIDDGRREHLVLYDEASITRLLERSGFSDVALYDGWTNEPYDGGSLMVVTATASPR